MSRLREPRVLLAVAAAAVLAAVLAVAAGPHPPSIGDARTGDRALAADTLEALGSERGHSAVAVARIEDGRVSAVAGLGRTGGEPVTAATAFELGSVTKTMTGMLLADAVSRGRVRLDQPVGEFLPALRATDAAPISLAELASHRSGLPRLPREDAGDFVGPLAARLSAANPYAGRSASDVVAAAGRTADAERRGKFAYSNLGAALLGHALAAAEGTTYPALLRARLLEPLELSATRTLEAGDRPPAGATVGRAPGGRVAEGWRGAGYAPAGIGTWSTAGDLGRYVGAAMAGSAPGAAATRDRYDRGEPGRRVGLGWMTRREAGQEIVWHNGATGGFHSFVGFDRAAGRGIALLATGGSVDAAGLALLEARRREGGGGLLGSLWPLLTLAFTLAAASALWSPIRARGPKADRLAILTGAVGAVGTLVVIGAVGAWDRVPVAVFVLGAALAGAALALAALRWPGLPWIAARPRLRLVGAVAAAVTWVVLVGLTLA